MPDPHAVTLAIAIDLLVEEFAAKGRTLDVERAAFGFWTTYPGGDLTFVEITTAVTNAAYQRNVRIARQLHIEHLNTEPGHT